MADLSTTAQPYQDIFVGDGEMAGLMRSKDWSSTALGPPETWPNSLKVAVRIMLTSRFDMWLGWGDDIAFLYNDAYIPTLGSKHPQSLGMATKVLWSEIWDDIRPLLEGVYQRGEATWNPSTLLLLNRNGYPEETYHTFSYSPLLDDDGRVAGSFCAVSEDTDRIISERRLALLRDLAVALDPTESRDAVIAAAAGTLARNTHDLVFSLLYRFTDDGTPSLDAAIGIDPAHACAVIHEGQHDGCWQLSRVWRGEPVGRLDISGMTGLATGAWDIPPTTAAVVPIPGQGDDRPFGAMVVGLNPYRPADATYPPWLDLLAGQIASSLANAAAYEAERQRAAALSEAVRLRQEAAEALARINAGLVSEVEMRTAESERLRSLFRQAPSFMCILTGPDHIFELVNDAYLQLVGHRDLIGLPVRQALPDIGGQGFFELLDSVYATGEAFVGRSLTALIERTAGAPLEERVLNLVYQPILGPDGRPMGIFVDGFDVTDQRRAEGELQALNETLEHRVETRTLELAEALTQLRQQSAEREAAEAALRQAQKIEALGKLTGGVAHDFNNLLQVVSGNLQLLGSDIIGNARAERRVRNAMAGVDRGAKLAAQLLAFGRRQPLAPKVINIGRFIKNMDDMLRRALGEEIEIETVIAGGLWNTLIDPGQIENAILNLAINARDAMDGEGRLTIEAGNASLNDDYARIHEDVAPGQYVMIAVTDTGTGISADILDQVFEPFYSTKPEGKGTGLGLSMVHGLVKQSGGHIKIYSEVGEGTTIRLYLPRANQSEDILTDTTDTAAPGGAETILVVEDDDAVRETAVAMLTDLGYRILKARDAASALVIVESGIPIDLLFTDVVMPGPLRSPELARKARERQPGIAVLFTSGYTENAIVHGGRLDPGVELLSKPYHRDALARKVRQVINSQAEINAATR